MHLYSRNRRRTPMNSSVAVIVTYNRKVLLEECIQAIQAQKNASCDILIVDNASTDGTHEHIQKYIDNYTVFYHNTGANLGGAGGFAAGMEKAVQMGYEYIWAMDDDTIVQEDSLQYLLKADKDLNGNYGFLSSVAYWTDGKLCNMNIQRRTYRKKIEDYTSEYSNAVMATFVAFFIKSSVIKEMGLPIAEFFIWSDDFEYSRRISKKYPCYVVTKSKVTHKMNSNLKVGIEQESKDRLWRYNYLYRNEVYVYRREGLAGYLYLFMRVALHMTRIILKAKQDKGEKLKIVWKSFMSGFKFKPAIQYVKNEGEK